MIRAMVERWFTRFWNATSEQERFVLLVIVGIVLFVLTLRANIMVDALKVVR